MYRARAPISDVNPVGEVARYEFCYDMMESEVKKFGSLFGESVDWSVVKSHACVVVVHHRKDLIAICLVVLSLREAFGVLGV
ncbi:type VI secretion system ImpA family N-terminal domain-containing protein, partial [Vibrio parahaemolyticus]|nr:type VI secretion system ImpA family N-terminal domain-containing protein [Vibrio parahaemolyticus]